MKSNGICIGCLHRKEGGYLPCNHPVVQEELADILFDSAHLATATAYANIRRRLGLKFEQASWNVEECGGRS